MDSRTLSLPHRLVGADEAADRFGGFVGATGTCKDTFLHTLLMDR